MDTNKITHCQLQTFFMMSTPMSVIKFAKDAIYEF